MQRVKYIILTLVSVLTIGFSSMSAFAMPAPVNPSGFTPQVIAGGSGSMTPQTLSNSVFFGLGLTSPTSGTDPLGILTDPSDALTDDQYFSSVKDALNAKVPGLGVTFVDFIKAYTSGLATTWKNAISIPANLWAQLKSATSDGLDFTTHVAGPSFENAYDIYEYFQSLGYLGQFDEKFASFYNGWVNSGSPNIYIFIGHDIWSHSKPETEVRIFMACNVTYSVDAEHNSIGFTQSGEHNAYLLKYYPESWSYGNDALSYEVWYGSSYGQGSVIIDSIYSSAGYDTTTSLNQDPEVAALLQNGSYGLVSKGSTYENDVFQEGDVIIQPVDNETLKGLVTQVNNDALPLSDALQQLGIMPLDTQTGILLNPNLDLATAQNLALNIDPASATDPLLDTIFPQLNEFQFFIPDGIAGVMNWVAIQMQTVFAITQMQNVFLVSSTIVVVALLLGLVRLWR